MNLFKAASDKLYETAINAHIVPVLQKLVGNAATITSAEIQLGKGCGLVTFTLPTGDAHFASVAIRREGGKLYITPQRLDGTDLAGPLIREFELKQ